MSVVKRNAARYDSIGVVMPIERRDSSRGDTVSHATPNTKHHTPRYGEITTSRSAGDARPQSGPGGGGDPPQDPERGRPVAPPQPAGTGGPRPGVHVPPRGGGDGQAPAGAGGEGPREARDPGRADGVPGLLRPPPDHRGDRGGPAGPRPPPHPEHRGRRRPHDREEGVAGGPPPPGPRGDRRGGGGAGPPALHRPRGRPPRGGAAGGGPGGGGQPPRPPPGGGSRGGGPHRP